LNLINAGADIWFGIDWYWSDLKLKLDETDLVRTNQVTEGFYMEISPFQSEHTENKKGVMRN
jgi:hypothetical protein